MFKYYRPIYRHFCKQPFLFVNIPFAIVLFIFFHEVLLHPFSYFVSGGNSDIIHEFIGMRHFQKQALLSGELPLWNPHIFCGTSLISDPQSYLFYPFILLYVFIDPIVLALNIDTFLHVWLTYIFTFYWLRESGNRVPASVTGALLFVFGWQLIDINYGHQTVIATSTWTPLTLLAIEKILKNKQITKWIAIGSLSVGLSLLGGNFQLSFFTYIGVFLYILIKSNMNKKAIAYTLPVFVLGALIAAVQLFPSIDFLDQSFRNTWSKQELGIGSFNPWSIITFVSPDFFREDLTHKSIVYWGEKPINFNILYISVSGIFMLVVSLTRSGIQHKLIFALCVFLLFVSMGSNSFLFDYLTKLPILSNLRNYAKFNFIITLFLIYLITQGLNTFLNEGLTKKQLLINISLFVAITATSIYVNFIDFGSWKQLMSSFNNEAAKQLSDSQLFLLKSKKYSHKAMITSGIILLVSMLIIFISRLNIRNAYLYVPILLFSAFHYTIEFNEKTVSKVIGNNKALKNLSKNMKPGERIYNAFESNTFIISDLYAIDGVNNYVLTSRFSTFIFNLQS